MMKPTEYFIQLRGRKCECCNLPASSLQRHHWLYHRDKRFPILDDERNIGLVCEICHSSGKVNSYESRNMFYTRQLLRYPDLNMWLANLPFKTKQYFYVVPLNASQGILA
jgi:hypothetical protein